ncbi:MAG: hypothetical protein KAI24_05400, partial [Planctomycetes bacterium]|nr:hypothetical protein [Planctomycetota bacterium]
QHRVADAQRRLADAARGLHGSTTLRLQRERGELRHTVTRLVHQSQRVCERAATALRQAETRRRLLDPTRVLQRGFAIVRGADGRIAPSATRVSKDQQLRLQFRDGSADVRVDAVETDQP